MSPVRPHLLIAYSIFNTKLLLCPISFTHIWALCCIPIPTYILTIYFNHVIFFLNCSFHSVLSAMERMSSSVTTFLSSFLLIGINTNHVSSLPLSLLVSLYLHVGIPISLSISFLIPPITPSQYFSIFQRWQVICLVSFVRWWMTLSISF